jgi:hypothetical protein
MKLEPHEAARAAYAARQARKREGVIVRATERAARTPQEQWMLLDRRLGCGRGAVKERTRLVAPILELS